MRQKPQETHSIEPIGAATFYLMMTLAQLVYKLLQGDYP